MTRMAGKTALITGAARGLGAQIARRFHEHGAHVIINDLNLAAAKATAQAPQGDAVACDVSDSASVRAMSAEVAALTPKLDIRVNNAGISGVEGDNITSDRIARMVEALAAGQNPRRASPATSPTMATTSGTA